MGNSIDFVHLHAHSHYSMLHALPSPEDLVKKAVALGFKALALTDLNMCAGFFRFVTCCQKNGIKPILGSEVMIVPDRHHKQKGDASNRRNILLIAKNRTGYRNLLDISSESFVTGFYQKPRIDFEYLSSHSEGLICTTGDMYGLIPRLIWEKQNKAALEEIKKYHELFGSNFYFEIMSHDHDNGLSEQKREVMNTLFKIGKKLGIECFASNDVRYLSRDDHFAHEVYTCIENNKCIKNTERHSLHSSDFYMKSAGEMLAMFPNHPQLLQKTVEIADSIDEDVMEMGGDYVPGADISGGEDPSIFLRKLVYDGLAAKGLADRPEYRERIDYELQVFDTCGYVLYFLILWDFINNARQAKIRIGPGRGSAAGSLCLYALDVTALDPIEYDLLFERFLSVDTERSVGESDFGMEVVDG